MAGFLLLNLLARNSIDTIGAVVGTFRGVMGKGCLMKQSFLPLLALAVLLACGRPVLASWAWVSEETLIRDAELIVQGTVDRIEPGFSLGFSWGGLEYQRNYEYAVISVSDVLKGDTGIAEVRILQAAPIPPGSSGAGFGTDIRFAIGQEGAWLLNESPIQKNAFSVWHPFQYQPEGIVIEAAPEPSGLALATLALCGLQVLRRRFARR